MDPQRYFVDKHKVKENTQTNSTQKEQFLTCSTMAKNATEEKKQNAFLQDMEPFTAATTFSAIIQVGDPLGTPEA